MACVADNMVYVVSVGSIWVVSGLKTNSEMVEIGGSITVVVDGVMGMLSYAPHVNVLFTYLRIEVNKYQFHVVA